MVEDEQLGSAERNHRKRFATRINKVLDYIRQHLDEPLHLDMLSQVAASSRYHFHREFTATTGMPVHRFVQVLRLRRASMQLVFNPHASITDIGFEAGFANTESFSRAFKKLHGQSPGAFRKDPHWQPWQVTSPIHYAEEITTMNVTLIDFPDTMIAALEHHGPEHLVHRTSLQFIDWRRANGIRPDMGKTFGIHYSDPVNTLPEDYRLDIAVSVTEPVGPNDFGVVNKRIPAGRCAVVRHSGSRDFVSPAQWLYREWLPASGEQVRDYPMFFHYVNVGPGVRDQDMITDVYLPLK